MATTTLLLGCLNCSRKSSKQLFIVETGEARLKPKLDQMILSLAHTKKAGFFSHLRVQLEVLVAFVSF